MKRIEYGSRKAEPSYAQDSATVISEIAVEHATTRRPVTLGMVMALCNSDRVRKPWLEDQLGRLMYLGMLQKKAGGYVPTDAVMRRCFELARQISGKRKAA